MITRGRSVIRGHAQLPSCLLPVPKSGSANARYERECRGGAMHAGHHLVADETCVQAREYLAFANTRAKGTQSRLASSHVDTTLPATTCSVLLQWSEKAAAVGRTNRRELRASNEQTARRADVARPHGLPQASTVNAPNVCHSRAPRPVVCQGGSDGRACVARAGSGSAGWAHQRYRDSVIALALTHSLTHSLTHVPSHVPTVHVCSAAAAMLLTNDRLTTTNNDSSLATMSLWANLQAYGQRNIFCFFFFCITWLISFFNIVYVVHWNVLRSCSDL